MEIKNPNTKSRNFAKRGQRSQRKKSAIIPRGILPSNSMSGNRFKFTATYSADQTFNMSNFWGRYFKMVPGANGPNGASALQTTGYSPNIVSATAGVYMAYRILSVKWKFSFRNQEAFPIYVVILTIPSTSAASSNWVSNYSTDLSTRVGSRVLQLGDKLVTSANKTISGKFTTIGNNPGIDTKQIEFIGTYAAVPAYFDMLYVQAWSLDGSSTFNTGVGVATTNWFEFECEGITPNQGLAS